MASSIASTGKFRNPRVIPTLPPGYSLNEELSKYSPRYYLVRMRGGKAVRPFILSHRTLYDRSKGIMENSKSGAKNSRDHGIHGIELDFRPRSGVFFSAHDETSNRVTRGLGRWEDIRLQKILAEKLVIRGLNATGDGYAVNYEVTEDNVLELGEILEPYDGQTVQVDLRKGDMAAGIASLCRRPLDRDMVMPKGYNFEFHTFKDLDKAARELGAPPNWPTLLFWTFVFHPGPIMTAAIKTVVHDPASASAEDYRRLTYETIYTIAKTQIEPFLANTTPNNFVPEIGFCSLGLHYDRKTGTAKNPFDGSPINDPKVLASALLDLVLMDIATELQTARPGFKLGYCARLYDIGTPDGKRYVSDLVTGEVDQWPTGERGIANILRAIPGGLYPETQICNADDPHKEIAARAWIEYGKLDRTELKTISWCEWIKRGKKDAAMVEQALRDLNGPHYPNEWSA